MNGSRPSSYRFCSLQLLDTALSPTQSIRSPIGELLAFLVVLFLIPLLFPLLLIEMMVIYGRMLQDGIGR